MMNIFASFSDWTLPVAADIILIYLLVYGPFILGAAGIIVLTVAILQKKRPQKQIVAWIMLVAALVDGIIALSLHASGKL